MVEVHLLRSLPRMRRDVTSRMKDKTPEIARISSEFGEMYFDGPRAYGYGGYRYDGRWIPVARDIVAHFGLKAGDRVLDVGCAKGFLVKDLMSVCPGLDVYGVDVSTYALTHCEPEIVGRLHRGSAVDLPFPDGSFSAVISLNTIHNLERDDCRTALREIERLAPGRGFVQVDSYHSPEEKQIFLDWVLTARTHDYPEGWFELFRESGYTGDHYWTVVE